MAVLFLFLAGQRLGALNKFTFVIPAKAGIQ
jgi:hypothetical protein